MDRTVPAAAGHILAWIGNIEAPKGYGTIYGNNQHRLAKPLTSMTLKEVITEGPKWTRAYKSSAAGRYQFMNNTLKGLQKTLGLGDKQIFGADLQDRLGFHLLRGRGFDKWSVGNLSDAEFALGIAKEWASIPVLSTMKGNSRQVSRGQSYYAGDSLNKSLVSASEVESVIAAARKMDKRVPPGVELANPEIPRAVAQLEGSAPVPGMEEAGKVNAVLATLVASAASFRSFNPEQAASLFRTLLQVAGGVLATKGVMSNEDWAMISGPLLTLAVTAWGMWARSDKNLLVSAASVPTVQAVVVDSPVAASAVTDFRVVTAPQAARVGVV